MIALRVSNPVLSAAIAVLLHGALCAPAALAAERGQIVVLVRHAEKAAAPEPDVALSEAGRTRAEALAATLAGLRPDAIVVTQYRRSRETAEPLARALKLTPIVVQTGGDVAAHARRAADAVRAAGDVVVVVGHSNTVPAIIAALGGPSLDEICETEYAHLFTVVRLAGEPPRLIQSLYGAADPPRSGECARAMKQE